MIAIAGTAIGVVITGLFLGVATLVSRLRRTRVTTQEPTPRLP